MITKNTTHPQQQKETQMNKKAWLDTLYYDLGHQWTNFWTTSTWLKKWGTNIHQMEDLPRSPRERRVMVNH